ncbi:MAG: DUF4388 domain-containing protein [Acidobacteria bacterium]|nr:DUF4388 domain-containing protein [Acidobacteriota bacterium]
MSEGLSIQGNLADTTVPDLFRSVIRGSETAIVSLESADRSDVIYFHEGKIIFASSTDPDTGLAEVLLRSGELSIEQYDTAMDRVVVSRRMGALLCELGYLQPDELLPATERQASAIILHALAYRVGNYTIEFTSELPDGIISLPLSTERLILDGVRAIDYWSLIMRGIMRVSRLLEAASGADMRSYHLELSDEEAHVLSLLADGPQSVQTLCSRSYLSNFSTCRTIWGLLAINLIQDAEGAEVEEKRAALESEYEMEGAVERYNTVFEKIFRLVFQKIGDHVYDFVDRVVLHLSPDILPYLSGMSLVNESRIDIDQLLNNLVASGSEDREAIVLIVLNELLTGWIFEVRREFGGALDAEVVKIAATLKRR